MKSFTDDFKRLDDVGKVSRGKSKHRPRNAPSLYGGIYPFIQTGDVKSSNFYITDYTQTYSDLGLKQSKLWPVGTLCITIAANIAETAILKIPACFPDSIIGFTPYPDKSDVRFIKYCIDVYKTQMQSISQGTTQDNLSADKLLSIEMRIPPLPVQKKIAAVLSTYDDLIENNTRRIALLEKMAEEIYREWFVRLRFPGHEGVKVVNGVPEGWEVKRLDDIAEFAYGKALKDENRIEGNYPVLGSSGIVGTHNIYLVEGPGIVIGRKGNVGSVHWVEENFFPIDTAYYLKSELSLFYMFYLIKSLNFLNNDSAVPGLNRNQAYANQIILPSQNIIDQFENLISSIFVQKKLISVSVNLLKTTRDALLSRLLSGKIDIENLDIAFPPAMSSAE